MDFTPKTTFSKGPSATVWTNIASSSEFRDAASAAMLQMQANLPYTNQTVDASSNHWRMEGARTFLAILMNLTTPPSETPPRIKSDNLNHTI